jgi:hypothetical protein
VTKFCTVAVRFESGGVGNPLFCVEEFIVLLTVSLTVVSGSGEVIVQFMVSKADWSCLA